MGTHIVLIKEKKNIVLLIKRYTSAVSTETETIEIPFNHVVKGSVHGKLEQCGR